MQKTDTFVTDFDGTLAEDGRVDGATLEALRTWRAAGRSAILATGRELEDLQKIFSHLDIFQVIVAENGAVLFWPAEQRVELLASAPNQDLVTELRARGVAPLSVGRCIIATWEPHQNACLESIHHLGLELQVIFNKTAVMILPTGVNKASGTLAALERMKSGAAGLAGIGDAENDHSMLEICAVSAAVSNAVPSLKERAHVVTAGARGAGVTEFITQLLKAVSTPP